MATEIQIWVGAVARMLRQEAGAGCSRDRVESRADDYLSEIAGRAMRIKLEAAREKGRSGWWRPEECSIESLRALLVEHLDKGDYVDVMIFAAMVAFREIADAETEAAK